MANTLSPPVFNRPMLASMTALMSKSSKSMATVSLWSAVAIDSQSSVPGAFALVTSTLLM